MNKINPQRDERIAKLTRAGWTADRIAREFGINARSVQRARVRTGVAQTKTPLMTEAEISRAADMLDDGASYAEVARSIGRCVETVRRQLPGRSSWTSGGFKWMQALDAIGAPIPFKLVP